MAGYNAMRNPNTNLPADWIVLGTAFKVFEAMLEASNLKLSPVVPEGFALVPIRPTKEMERVMQQEDWSWPDLLVAAEAVTEEQYHLEQQAGTCPVA